MRGLLSLIVTLAGLLLVLQVVAPLYVFIRGLEDGVSIEVYEDGGAVVVSLVYMLDVPLVDAKLIVNAGGEVYTAEDSILSRGEELKARLPLDADDIESVSFEGRVAGLYYVSIALRAGGP